MSGVYLIRHCSATGQEPDAPLTAAGLEQATVLAARLAPKGFRRIISSHYARAVQSAEPLAKACGVEIEIDERLCERTLGQVPDGDWQTALIQTYAQPDLVFPDGESTRQATLRARSVIDGCITSDRRPVAIFTHGNLLSLIARSFDPSLGFDFWRALTNPDVFELVEADNSFLVARMD